MTLTVFATSTKSYGWGLPRHETGVRPDPVAYMSQF